MAEGRLLEVHATVRPERPEVETLQVGDRAVVTVHARTDGDGTLRWPSEAEITSAYQGAAVVLGARPSDATAPPAATAVPDGGASERSWTVVLLLPPGEHDLPDLTVSLVGDDGETLDSAAVPGPTIRLESVLEPHEQVALDQVTEETQPAALLELMSGPRGPWAVSGPSGYLAIVLVWIALLATTVAGLWWLRRGGSGAAASSIPREPPHVKAQRRLAALRDGGALDRGEWLAFHVELADILKTYVGEVHAVDVLDRTTLEVRRLLAGELSARPGIVDVAPDLLSVLASCDLVKFARAVPPREDSSRDWDTVSRVVEVTQAALEQAAAEAAARAAAAERRGAA